MASSSTTRIDLALTVMIVQHWDAKGQLNPVTRTKLLIGVAAILIAAVIGGILLNQPSQQGDALRIGVLLPLTGEGASYGEDCRRGIELALDNFRKRGAKPVEVVFEDTKIDPKTAISAFNKLVSVDKSQAIIGDMFSSTTLAVAPLAQQASVVLLTPTAADERIPATGDHVFSIYPSASSEGQFMAERLEIETLQRVAVLYQNQTATKGIADAFADAVRKRGGSVAIVESIPDEKSSYRSLLERVAARRPSSIFISAYRDPVAMLITMGRESGLNVPYVTQSTLYDEKALVDYADKLEGVLLSGPYFDSTSDAAAVKKFFADYQARFGKPPSVWSAYGYDAADILLTALVEAANEKVSVGSKLAGRVFSGLTGRTDIKQDRSIEKEMVLYSIQGNTFVRR